MLKDSNVDAFNGAQGRILYILWEYDRLPISEIGKYTSLAKTTLTSMVDRMEENGLVSRIPDKEDRRQVLVSITEKAKQYRNKYNEISDQMNAVFYKGFSGNDIKLFESTLEKIISNLEKNQEESRIIMNIYSAIEARRTIRDFQDKPIPMEVIERIISAGLKAPTNDHLRSWDFVLIDDKQERKKLLRITPLENADEINNQLDDWGLRDETQRDMYLKALPRQYSMLYRAACLILPFFRS